MKPVLMAIIGFFVSSIPFAFGYASIVLGPGSPADRLGCLGFLSMFHIVVSGAISVCAYEMSGDL